jgi:hypothetical protein
MVVHFCNSSTPEAEAGRSRLKASLGYRICLKKAKQQKEEMRRRRKRRRRRKGRSFRIKKWA